MFKTFFFKKETAQQLAMFTSTTPAIQQMSWTVKQILELLDLKQPTEYSREALQLMFTDAATSLLQFDGGSKEALKFVSSLQQLLMEFLFSNGFSISLRDFIVGFPADTSHHSLRPIVEEFIHRSSSLGQLIDPKSDSSINKLVQQIGFLGPQLFHAGKLYSRFLAESMSDHYIQTYHPIPIENNSFVHGFNPYEELVHSIPMRELIVCSMRGI